MAYNMTEFEACRHVLCSFKAVNTLSGNILAHFGLVVLWVVLFFSLMRRNPPPESFTAAGGVVTVISLLGLAADLVGMVWVIGFTLVFAMSAVGVYLRNKNS